MFTSDTDEESSIAMEKIISEAHEEFTLDDLYNLYIAAKFNDGSENKYVTVENNAMMTYLYKLYERGLKRFNNHYELELSYICFLLELGQYKNLALEKAIVLESRAKDFTTQFVIQTVKDLLAKQTYEKSHRLIEDEDEEEVELNYEIIVNKKLEEKLEELLLKAAVATSDFFQMLEEEGLQVQRAQTQLAKVQKAKGRVESFWEEFHRTFEKNNALCEKIFYFFRNIFDKLEIAGIDTTQWLEEYANSQRHLINISIQAKEGASSFSDPVIFVKIVENNLLIEDVNSALLRLTGSNRKDLLGNHLGVLMIKQQFEMYLRLVLKEKRLGNSHQSNVVLFLKKKNGFLKRVFATQKLVMTMGDNFIIIQITKVDLINNTAHIVVDGKGNVLGFDSAIYSVFPRLAKCHNSRMLQAYLRSADSLFHMNSQRANENMRNTLDEIMFNKHFMENGSKTVPKLIAPKMVIKTKGKGPSSNSNYEYKQYSKALSRQSESPDFNDQGAFENLGLGLRKEHFEVMVTIQAISVANRVLEGVFCLIVPMMKALTPPNPRLSYDRTFGTNQAVAISKMLVPKRQFKYHLANDIFYMIDVDVDRNAPNANNNVRQRKLPNQVKDKLENDEIEFINRLLHVTATSSRKNIMEREAIDWGEGIHLKKLGYENNYVSFQPF